jgi:hypothetical protein
MVNIAWPRDTEAPWYSQWGVVLITVIIGLIGVIAYSSNRRHILSADVSVGVSK